MTEPAAENRSYVKPDEYCHYCGTWRDPEEIYMGACRDEEACIKRFLDPDPYWMLDA
jgi:hypothetical protein